ncbi:MAG: hypothetical protein ABJO67_21050 [Pseudoruegeria sp.]
MTSAAIAINFGTAAANLFGLGREINTVETEEDILDSRRVVFNNNVGLMVADYARDNGLPEEALDELAIDALNRGL